MRIHLRGVATCIALLAAVALLFVELNAPAVGLDDFGSSIPGALDASLEDLSLSQDLGKLSFLLNGGFALLSGAFACFAVAIRPHAPMSGHDHWRSGDSVTSI
jgi:hypothetical protein